MEKFTASEALTAEKLNQLVDEAESQEFTDTVKLSSATGGTFLLTVTSSGLQIKKDVENSGTVTIRQDGSIECKRKKLTIFAHCLPGQVTYAYKFGSDNWNKVGWYRLAGQANLGNGSISGSQRVKVYKEDGIFKATAYDLYTKKETQITGTASGLSFYCIHEGFVRYFPESGGDITYEYDGSGEIFIDLSQSTSSVSAPLAMSAPMQGSDPLSDAPIPFSELREE